MINRIVTFFIYLTYFISLASFSFNYYLKYTNLTFDQFKKQYFPSEKDTKSEQKIPLYTQSEIAIDFTRMNGQGYGELFDITTGQENVSLEKTKNGANLQIGQGGTTVLFVKPITAAKNFEILTKFIPLESGIFILAVRTQTDNVFGYYLEFTGIGYKTWHIYKLKTRGRTDMKRILDNGEVPGGEPLEANKPLWVKMRLYNDTITAYLSYNGKNYIQLSKISDNEYSRGRIGMVATSRLLIENLYYRKLE